MGTIIEMVSVAPAHGRVSARGTLKLSKKAAQTCLSESGIKPSELQLLLYSGIYRDEHIGEPSIASLVQKEIGANPNLHPLEFRTFSFDVHNGGCGLVNAMQIIDGFITSGKITTGMVISGDSEPFRRLSEHYNFRSASSALILKKSEIDAGFKVIKTYAYPEYQNSFKSYISWRKIKKRIRKKNVLVVEQSDNYLRECLECTNKSLQDFFQNTDLTMGDIDLVVSSQSPSGFSRELEKIFGSDGKVVMTNSAIRGELHTAGPAFALHKAWEDGSFQRAKNILFVTVGSGISNGLALYHNG